jgi:hypothetical protein
MSPYDRDRSGCVRAGVPGRRRQRRDILDASSWLPDDHASRQVAERVCHSPNAEFVLPRPRPMKRAGGADRRYERAQFLDETNWRLV